MSSFDIAAYFWPAYHDEPRWRPFFKGTEGEWEIIRNAKPKFPGHYQPRVPLWGFEDEASPAAMAKKIDAAADHGVNVMIFDWYWYDNQPFLEKTIDAFLAAPNVGRMKFFLMWANHDATTLWDLERSHKDEVIWPGGVDRSTFDAVANRVINRYMTHPSYYRIEGKPVFSVYHINNLVNGLGGLEQARDALDGLRGKAASAGLGGLHLQAVVTSEIPQIPPPGGGEARHANTLALLGFDSATCYQWCHFVQPKGPYETWAKHSIPLWDMWTAEYSMPFFPHVSIGWDTNPRFKGLLDAVIEPSVEGFADSLQQAKAFIARNNLQPRLITINSWNEWGEGSYLEPDTRFGMQYLEAVKEVFGD